MASLLLGFGFPMFAYGFGSFKHILNNWLYPPKNHKNKYKKQKHKNYFSTIIPLSYLFVNIDTQRNYSQWKSQHSIATIAKITFYGIFGPNKVNAYP